MHTQSRLVRRLVLALAATAALAAPGAAQQVRDRILTENPTRTIGGSCIYGGDGKLIHAPRNAVCPASEEAPAVAPAHAAALREDGMRTEAAALLAEREHLDVELARVREAFAYEDREAASAAVEAALSKIAQHLEREARLLQELRAAPASPQP